MVVVVRVEQVKQGRFLGKQTLLYDFLLFWGPGIMSLGWSWD